VPRVDVVRTYLELCNRADLRPAPLPPGAHVVRRDPCAVDRYRRLYQAVGAPWYWRDRLVWTDEQLATHLSSPDVSVWELLVGGRSAGYFELKRDDRSVEIAYFGLVPEFIGQGLGSALLTRAVDEAWAFGAGRVWLHTCTLDSPHALPNYRSRGFREFKTECYETDV
jgi:GNAT superfamily N-acetyltransferase